MLAKLADELPAGGGYLCEPKWDGFRAIVFRGAEDVYIQSRDSRPLDRYFPELHGALLERLPKNCVVDGEIVIATPKGSISTPCSSGCIRPSRGSRSWRRRRPPLSLPSICCSGGKTARFRKPSAASLWKKYWAK